MFSATSALDDARRALAGRIEFLPDKPEETLESTIRALWFAAAGMPRSAEAALLGEPPELDDVAVATFEVLLNKRLDGVPLSHLTFRQRFMGLEMLADPRALIPRKETELLATAAVQATKQSASVHERPIVVDVCTGSGNVALAIAHHVESAHVFGADLSGEAVALARDNARLLGLQDRVEFRSGDLLSPFESEAFVGKIDVLTCNPPYINSAKVSTMSCEISDHEPRLAFDGGPLGIGILMKLTQQAPRFLRPGGWLAIEVGLGQGPALVKRLQANPLFTYVECHEGEHGALRVIVARC
ncbi:N5-glutamine methyltransferase family protein [Steroidobacter agaridevorans]|uniref:N5-glutamine methyltransferase family protein n=1 Tax=Steroidobacter agaridevorans TaxID=2695856 RepID=UPI00192A66CF|nr:HemK/PrmC family methyltransferase [Steroidobacter agaridevorans]